MNYVFPDVDTLMQIAQKDPDALDRIKQEAVSALIDSAEPSHQQRLRGLQWQVDMELKKSKNPMESCIKVSEMMHEKLWELRAALQSEEHGELEGFYESELEDGAEILPFRS
tara:strand:- start:9882 stop:10217 length:336 start_codon:yes stop_codon:yes gene_type:complete